MEDAIQQALPLELPGQALSGGHGDPPLHATLEGTPSSLSSLPPEECIILKWI